MKQYSNACDLWSAGVILYIMLSGYPPFYGENDIEVFEKVINYQFDFEGIFDLSHFIIDRWGLGGSVSWS